MGRNRIFNYFKIFVYFWYIYRDIILKYINFIGAYYIYNTIMKYI